VNDVLGSTLAVLLLAAISPFAAAQTPANPPAAVPVATAPVQHFILVAKFERPLSSSKLKAGDSLTARTVKPATLPDGTHLPKGSHLVARIIAVRTGQPGQDSTLLAFRFESALAKGHPDIPIHGEVVAIGPELSRELGLGTSVLGRGGIAGYSGVDPKASLGATDEGDETGIPPGSTLKGVTLGVHKEDSVTAVLESSRKDITLTQDTVVRIELK